MRKLFCFICLNFLVLGAQSQHIDAELIKIKKQLQNVTEAWAKAKLTLDIDFINMPVKYADLHYQKGKPIAVESDNFMMVPKRGLDFSWSELFEHDFMTIDRGVEKFQGNTLKIINVIPLDNKSDYAIMKLRLDTIQINIVTADITTKENGSYVLHMEYGEHNFFPSKLTIGFELERIKIPLNFLGKDMALDKKVLKNNSIKRGRIILDLDWVKSVSLD